MPITFNHESRFLFIGDGVTDSGRASDHEGIGNGYVRMIRDHLRAKHPPVAPICINRGVAGDRLIDLAARWQQDVIAERPSVVSIQIGVDDHSSRPPHSTPGDSLDQYRTVFRHILAHTARDLPRSKLILFDPTALWTNAAVQADEYLKSYTDSLMEMGREYNVFAMVPLHSAFVYARRNRPDIPWADESGHPTSSGHMVIAHTWMEQAGVIQRL